MTVLQKLVLCTGLAAILAMMAVPPNIVMESSGDTSSFSVFRVIRYKPFFTETVKKIHYPRLLLQCLIALTATVGLLWICGRTQKSALGRARKLAQLSERFRQEAAERTQGEERLQRLNAELTATNKKLKQEIAQRTHAQENLQQPNAKLTETIEKLKQEIAQLTQTEKKLQQQNAKLAATNEQLKQEVADLNEVEKELQGYRDQIEQYFEQQDSQSTIPNEQPQPETAEPDKKAETAKAGKKSSDKPPGPLGQKFDMMRNRMVNDIEDLNDIIKDGDL